MKYVGSQLSENAYDYASTDSLSEFVDGLAPNERPDMLFSLSPQWLLARDFHKLTVPKVIWCHDLDAFQYRNVDNYSLYDVAICNCSQEHFELSQGTPGLFCAANMLLHPLATPFPEASPHREKTFDIIFTGSALAPFHSEKPRFLFQLAELGGTYKVQVIEGHMPEKQYFEVISHAKFLPVVNRYAGSPSPRWRDALANGAFLLYPKGTFYGEIAPGCFPFGAETMVQDIAGHVDRFDAGGDPDYDLAHRGSGGERALLHPPPAARGELRAAAQIRVVHGSGLAARRGRQTVTAAAARLADAGGRLRPVRDQPRSRSDQPESAQASGRTISPTISTTTMPRIFTRSWSLRSTRAAKRGPGRRGRIGISARDWRGIRIRCRCCSTRRTGVFSSRMPTVTAVER